MQGASTADGGNIVQYADWGGTNQQWQLVRVGGSTTTTPPPTGGTFTNPVVWQDFADGDIIRVGDAYYYSASTMHYSPGAPILRSYDLVELGVRRALGAAPGLRLQRLRPERRPRVRRRASGRRRSTTARATARTTGSAASSSTAPTSTPRPRSTAPGRRRPGSTTATTTPACWSTTTTPCTSRTATAPSASPSCRADGTSQVRAQQVFQTPSSVGTLEGSRFYKRNGYYYIWVTRPANGQYVLRSTSPFGPYEMRQVLLNLPGPISGGGVPHQGGLVQTQNGDWYYMAFVDAYPGGRVPVAGADHLDRRRLAGRCRPSTARWGSHVPEPNIPTRQDGRLDDRHGHLHRHHARPAVGVEPQPGHQQVQRGQRAAAADRHRDQRPVQRPQHPDPPHPGPDVDGDDRAGLLDDGATATGPGWRCCATRRPGSASDATTAPPGW